MTPSETLAWEAQHRKRAGAAALAAALLTIVGALISATALPRGDRFDEKILTVVDTMRSAVEGQPIAGGRLSAFAIELGQDPALPIFGAVLYGIGSLLIFLPLAYLFRATRARRPNLPQVALVMAAVGSVGLGVGRIVGDIGRAVGAAGFVDAADHSNSAAADALQPTAALIGQLIAQLGMFALAFAFVIIALNAMRVGLLTRFLGVLGIIVGATFVLPLDQQGIIRTFWLAAIGMLVLGRLPRGVPQAWETGEAQPWPTQQELREQRQALRDEAAGEPSTPREPAQPPAPRRPEPAAATHVSSKKKRKRRS